MAKYLAINKSAFESASPEEIKNVEHILRKNRIIGNDDKLVANSDSNIVDLNELKKEGDLLEGFPGNLIDGARKAVGDVAKAAGINPCEVVCDLAATAALAACSGLSGPGLAVCLLAVEEARKECKKNC